MLVVDDNSPDGTGAIAESVAAEISGVTVLHRPGKAGLGSAYREGFAHVLDGLVRMSGHAVEVRVDARVEFAAVMCRLAGLEEFQSPGFADYDAAVEAVRRGECVGVYPEGTITRDPDGWPMRGKTGAATKML